MPRTKKKSAKVATKDKAISVVFDVAGEVFNGSGDTIIEAIEQITPPNYFKGKAVITVTAGQLKAETLMYPPMLKRLFMNRMSREIFQKRIASVMK